MSGRDARNIETKIAQLRDLGLDELRRRWRTAFGRTAPNLPKHLLLRLLAYRLQAQVYGDLSRTTTQFLDNLVRQKIGSEVSASGGVALPGHGQLSTGTILVREHGGERHHVMVVEGGFACNGKTYPSLTKVAHAITGTNWNGPRFFGLRDKTRETQR